MSYDRRNNLSSKKSETMVARASHGHMFSREILPLRQHNAEDEYMKYLKEFSSQIYYQKDLEKLL